MKLVYDLESTPLQIRTNGEIGSNEVLQLWFYTAAELDVGGVIFFFRSPPQYSLVHCSSSSDFPVDLPSGTPKLWTITLTRTSGIRLTVHCNDVEVLNVVISGAICGSSYSLYTRWDRQVGKILFHHDTASDQYRPGE